MINGLRNVHSHFFWRHLSWISFHHYIYTSSYNSLGRDTNTINAVCSTCLTSNAPITCHIQSEVFSTHPPRDKYTSQVTAVYNIPCSQPTKPPWRAWASGNERWITNRQTKHRPVEAAHTLSECCLLPLQVFPPVFHVTETSLGSTFTAFFFSLTQE